MVKLTEKDVQFTFTTGGGPGGQNVNKVATKATLFFDVDDSSLTDAQKARIKEKSNRLNKAGQIVISSSTERSQKQNKENALRVLNEHIKEVLKKKKKRNKEKPEAVKRRIAQGNKEAKKRRKQKKERRRISYE